MDVSSGSVADIGRGLAFDPLSARKGHRGHLCRRAFLDAVLWVSELEGRVRATVRGFESHSRPIIKYRRAAQANIGNQFDLESSSRVDR